MVAYNEMADADTVADTVAAPRGLPAGVPEEDMSTTEERMTILRMIEQGKISPEEGARLLTALGQRGSESAAPRANYFDASRMLRVRVTEIGTQRHKVDVALPVGLARLALRFIPASARVDVDAIEEAIDAGAGGLLTEVIDQEHGVRVEISLR